MAMTGGTAKLVKTTYPFTDKTKAVNLYVYYKSSQSVADNKSTVTVGMYVTTPSGWDIGSWTDYNGSYVGTTANTFNGTIPNFSGTRWLVENKTFTVTHNADGTGKATIYWKWGVNSPWGGYVNPSGSFSIDLPTIARATTPTLSATSVQMGKTIKVTMNRAASSFTHKLKYTINGVTGDIASSLGTSYTWTIPKDLVRHIPNLLQAAVTITCETYSGGSKIGEKTVSFTATVPSASAPTLSASSVQMGKSVTITTNREVSYYTHTLKYTLSDATGTIATGVTTSKAWTVPDLVQKIPNLLKGTVTITCETYNGTAKVGAKTVSLTVTVPNASVPTLSISSVQMGNTVTITTNRTVSNYTHTLKYTLNGTTGIIATGVTTSKVWTVPDLVALIPNATSGNATITCETYNGTAMVGSKTVGLVIKAYSATAPVFSSETVQLGKTVTISLGRASAKYTHNLTYAIGSASGNIGTQVGTSKTWTVPATFIKEIQNATSATVTITCVTYNGTAIIGTVKKTINVTVLSGSDPQFVKNPVITEKATIIFNRQDTQYKHDIKITFGEKQITRYDIATDSVDILFPLEFATQVPNGTSGTGSLYCVTKNGTAIVGEKSVPFTATIPDNEQTKPKFTPIFEIINDNLPSKFDGILIQSKSKLKVKFAASSETSSIKSYSTKVQSATYNGNPAVTSAITQSGKIKLIYTVTDTRGYSRTKTDELTVIPYSKPHLIPYAGYSLICCRSLSDGTASAKGKYVLAQAKGACSAVEYENVTFNTCRLKYRYKTAKATDYDMDWIPLASNEINGILGDNEFDLKTAYSVQLAVEDDIGEERSYSFPIPYISVPIHEGEEGKNLGLGQYCDYSEAERIDVGWKTYFNTGIGSRVIFADTDGPGWLKGETLENKMPDADTSAFLNYTLFLAVINNTGDVPTAVLCVRTGNTICGSYIGGENANTYSIRINHVPDLTVLENLYATTGTPTIKALYALL